MNEGSITPRPLFHEDTLSINSAQEPLTAQSQPVEHETDVDADSGEYRAVEKSNNISTDAGSSEEEAGKFEPTSRRAHLNDDPVHLSEDDTTPADIPPPINIRIVLAGKSGAGKSTLESNLFDSEELNQIEMSPDQNTPKCKTGEHSKHGITIKLTDTVGIQAGRGGKERLRKLSDHTKGEADLLVYCVPVDPSSKFNDANPAIMQLLQDAHGKDIWKQCIIVFTFSNYAWDRNRKKNSKEDALSKYKRHINNYAAKVRDELANLNVCNVEVKTTHWKTLQEKPRY